MCDTQSRREIRHSATACFAAALLLFVSSDAVCGGVETLPQAAATGGVVRADNVTNSAAGVLSDILVAENAFKDRLYETARSRAVAAFYAKASDQAVRNRAFSVLMKVSETQLKAEEWLKMFEAGAFDGIAWPQGNGSFEALKGYWHARALSRASRHDEAVILLESVRKTVPAGDALEVPALRLQAFVLALDGRPGEGAALLEAAPASSPDVFMDRARLLVEAGRATEAAELLAPFAGDTNSVETAAVASLLMARAFNDSGRTTNAVALLSAAGSSADFKPDYRALAMSAAAMLTATHAAVTQSVDMAEKAVAMAESPMVRRECEMELARLLAKNGLAERAMERTRLLIAAAPRSQAVAAAVRDVGDNLLAAGLYEAALGTYTLFMSSFSAGPLDPFVQRGRAQALVGLGRHAEAAVAFMKAVEMSGADPDFRKANLFNVAEEQHASGSHRQAVATIAALVAQEPSGPLLAAARLLEAECVSELDPVAGTAAFLKVAEDFPDRHEGGMALFRAAQLTAAADAKAPSGEGKTRATQLYRRAAEFPEPQLKASSLLGAGLMCLHGGEYGEALALFEASAAVKGGGVACEQARYMKSEALLALGKDRDAVASAMELINDPRDSHWRREAIFWIGRRYFNTGDFAEAERYFSEFAGNWPEAPKADSALLLQAQAQFQQKKYEDAIDAAVKLVAQYPKSRCLPVANFIHAESLCELLRFDAALLLYNDVVAKAEGDELRLRAMGRRGDCFFTLGADNAVRYEESIAAYEEVLAHPADKQLETVLQCEYKIGRSLEKAGRADEAFDRYYRNVVLRVERDSAALASSFDSPVRIWYSRAVLDAADILERRGDREAEAAMLERIAGGGFPGADEAVRLLDRIKKNGHAPGLEATNP